MLFPRARFGGGVVRGCFSATGGRSRAVGEISVGTSETQEFDCVFYDGFDP
jgi:hypothetical protein